MAQQVLMTRGQPKDQPRWVAPRRVVGARCAEEMTRDQTKSDRRPSSLRHECAHSWG